MFLSLRVGSVELNRHDRTTGSPLRPLSSRTQKLFKIIHPHLTRTPSANPPACPLRGLDRPNRVNTYSGRAKIFLLEGYGVDLAENLHPDNWGDGSEVGSLTTRTILPFSICLPGVQNSPDVSYEFKGCQSKPHELENIYQVKSPKTIIFGHKVEFRQWEWRTDGNFLERSAHNQQGITLHEALVTNPVVIVTVLPGPMKLTKTKKIGMHETLWFYFFHSVSMQVFALVIYEEGCTYLSLSLGPWFALFQNKYKELCPIVHAQEETPFSYRSWIHLVGQSASEGGAFSVEWAEISKSRRGCVYRRGGTGHLHIWYTRRPRVLRQRHHIPQCESRHSRWYGWNAAFQIGKFWRLPFGRILEKD